MAHAAAWAGCAATASGAVNARPSGRSRRRHRLWVKSLDVKSLDMDNLTYGGRGLRGGYGAVEDEFLLEAAL
ncbi:hypothetical protein GCM10009555_003600 [Acrocarpospora macrocephala]|uniref:Uncharacterized protein n=1 Tax=Acrocarpospora macrocephala TaxID=150177 RepID=A0A5M3X7U3_9ACTN|nr:hypothetical protein Amac_098470 [Acrocarpospora macrocephala]